ncbi:hypothetical protein GCM10029992_15430 [Glycomyces albus]
MAGGQPGEAGDFNANANSTAMAAQAMLASDGRPEAAETSLAYLIGLQIGCGDDSAGAVRFSEDDDGSDPLSLQFATTQALVPLSGKSLAELDASGIEADLPDVGCDAEGDQPADATGDAGDDEESTSWLPWVIAGAVVLVVAAIAFTVVRGRRGSSTESAAGSGSASSSDEAKDEE